MSAVLEEQDKAQRYRFTIDDFMRIADAGIFDRQRVELIYGEVVVVNPAGPPHAWLVDCLMYWSIKSTDESKIWVRVQNPLGVPEFNSMPEPDVAWMKRRDYSERQPEPEDALLIIEVSHSSLQFDRTTKKKLYAESGIQDYWIVNAEEATVEVYRDPKGDHFQNMQTFAAGDAAAPLAAPDVKLQLSTLFG